MRASFARSLRAPAVAPRRAASVPRRAVAPPRQLVTVSAAAKWSPPTVADTKAAFTQSYRKPLPAIYNVVVQELLVQAHLAVHNINYAYSPLTALGATAALDAVLDGLPGDDAPAVYAAFTAALGMDPAKVRADAAALTAWAKEAGAAGLTAGEGAGGAALAELAARAAAGKLHYNRFMAVGLFKLLEAAGAKDPKALEAVVAAAGVPAAAVSRDLQTYKAALSKLAASKELMREMLERERKKAAERAAEKAAAAAAGGATEGGAEGAVPAPNAA